MHRRTFLAVSSSLVLAAPVLLRASIAHAKPPAAKPPAGKPPAGERSTLAVMYFDYTGKNEELGVLRKGFAQMLISDLSDNEAVRVVERDQLEALLQEQKLGASGKIDPTTAARVGRLLGARRMVLGGYFDLGKILRVDARLVDVETGQVLGSVGAMSKPDELVSVEGEIATGLERLLARIEPEPARARSREGQPARKRVKAPSRLATKTAVTYGKALTALDQGDKPKARELLALVVQEQADFALASRDLDRLIQ